MNRMKWLKLGATAVLCAVIALLLQGVQAQQQQEKKVTLPQHPPATGDGKSMVVQLCDGETNLTLEGVSPDARLTPEQAQSASDKLMAMWMAKVDPATAKTWRAEQAAAQKQATAQTGGAKKPAGGASGKNEQPNDFTARDTSTWKKEVEREVKYGDQIFHDDKLLGSTNGVSCAMCHPHGANTHAETYPKFQIQLRRVALLRDMINWCVENPSRGKKLDADDPKMRALEAYIMAQRKGVAMDYGKH